MSKPSFRFSESAVREHNVNRILNAAASTQRVGILVAAGAIKPQQQTFVARAVRDLRQPRLPGAHLSHLSAGGIYVVCKSGDPKYAFLRREHLEPDQHGYITAPLSYLAWSDEARRLIEGDLTITTPLHPAANRIDLAEEGTRGDQLPETAGLKTRLEHAISKVKTEVRSSMSVEEMTLMSLKELKLTYRDMVNRLEKRERALIKQAVGEAGEFLKQSLSIKLEVLRDCERVLGPDATNKLMASGARILELEKEVHPDRLAEAAKESYRAEESRAASTS